ncbi:MAG: elongation factor P maturation arginine rhamnosyltransferase EarP [Nitrosomonadales bacterium]|nr:elongation factor P maturation arginine rhamnosyltransferase EarP [Nitrosomonadales bacterium]
MKIDKFSRPASCDIFCNVVDNYGDIGVSWRLARILAKEHGLRVRLWVDDLHSFAMLCPEADVTREAQHCRGVEVRRWIADAFPPLPACRPPSPACGRGDGGEGVKGDEKLPDVIPAELVIEAFACKLPERYVAAMAAQRHKPVWLNLEYLSAESWVEDCHQLPSPHPNLPLTRHFFFPGFTRKTGGLLLERDLMVRRDKFQNDAGLQRTFWQGMGMEMPRSGTLKVSLFAYENAAVGGLLDVWAQGGDPVLCLVPEGRILPQVRQYFGEVASIDSPRPLAGEGPGERGNYSRGNLTVRVLPFVEQDRYDELLWACDVNFVRGEDSCVRAQWAGKPFIWQIYPQHDAVHWDKLQAFLGLYGASLGAESSRAMQGLWKEWNDEGKAWQAWPAFVAARGELGRRAQAWARELAWNDQALNLLDFSRKIGRMRAFEN